MVSRAPKIKSWKHAGLRCHIRRNPEILNYCGYVCLPVGHPFYEKGYDETEDLEVHGGLKYTDLEDGDWVVGFDCAHFGDFIGGLIEIMERTKNHTEAELTEIARKRNEHYWTLQEVVAETNRLAEQLAKVMPKENLLEL